MGDEKTSLCWGECQDNRTPEQIEAGRLQEETWFNAELELGRMIHNRTPVKMIMTNGYQAHVVMTGKDPCWIRCKAGEEKWMVQRNAIGTIVVEG